MAVFCAASVLMGSAWVWGPQALLAQAPPLVLPFAGAETLRFKLLWPSGVSLGEAILAVSAGQADLHFEMTLDADLPIHNIIGSFTAAATRDGLCSMQFHRKMTEGAKVSEDTMVFDQKAHQVHRTAGGQTISLPVPDCARDPLTFLYFFRARLVAGGPVDVATFFSGPDHLLEIKASGAEKIVVGGRQRAAEKYTVTYHGSRSATTFQLWMSADAQHQPLMVRLPSSLALFSAELE